LSIGCQKMKIASSSSQQGNGSMHFSLDKALQHRQICSI
jgi:hypothetical protein